MVKIKHCNQQLFHHQQIAWLKEKITGFSIWIYRQFYNNVKYERHAPVFISGVFICIWFLQMACDWLAQCWCTFLAKFAAQRLKQTTVFSTLAWNIILSLLRSKIWEGINKSKSLFKYSKIVSSFFPSYKCPLGLTLTGLGVYGALLIVLQNLAHQM